MKKPIIAPSILAADFSQLGKDIKMIDESVGEWVHFDVMDGRFVPNISFGMPILKAIRPLTKKKIDVHLMIEEPERYVADFAKLGADVLTIHAEACRHIDRTLHLIKDHGMLAGLAVNPATSEKVFKRVLPWVDVALIMSVNPGFGAQSFIPYTYDKIRALKEMILVQGTNTLIEIDGGVKLSNAQVLCAVGADVLVAGNTVFSADNPIEMIAELKAVGGKV